MKSFINLLFLKNLLVNKCDFLLNVCAIRAYAPISLFGKQTPLYDNSNGSKESLRMLNLDERDLEALSTPSRMQSTIDLCVKSPLLVPTSVVPGLLGYRSLSDGRSREDRSIVDRYQSIRLSVQLLTRPPIRQLKYKPSSFFSMNVFFCRTSQGENVLN